MAPNSPNNRGGRGKQPTQNGSSSFLLLFVILLFLNFYIVKTFFPPKEQNAAPPETIDKVMLDVQNQAAEPVEPSPVTETPATETPATETPATETPATETPATETPATETPATETPATETPATETPATETPATEDTATKTQYFSLGSADPESPYRMLVTLCNRGATVTCVEMNEKRLGSMNDSPRFKGGTLGTLTTSQMVRMFPWPMFPFKGTTELAQEGFRVEMVGTGTPAEKAGLKVGDWITKFNGEPVSTSADMAEAARCYKPGTEVSITFLRDGAEQTVKAVLTREPARVIQPEVGEQVGAFATTFSQFGKQELDSPKAEIGDKIPADPVSEGLQAYLGMELPGIALRQTAWEVESTAADNSQITFLCSIPHYGLEVRKTYTLAKVPEADRESESARAYHLELHVSVKNKGTHPRTIAIQQDGPSGLPTEGHWFCSKVSRGWGAVGIRDVAIGFEDAKDPTLVSCAEIVKGNWGVYELNQTRPIRYIGVDAQYFSALMMPDTSEGNAGILQYTSLRTSGVPEKWVTMTDTSCRLRCNGTILNPGEVSAQRFTIFLGPKRPELLETYGINNLLYYGWFSFVAVPMLAVLHFFYSFVGNYGIAILLLTVVVRLLMFPLSRKQTKGMILMQKLQPEMKKIQEKYEDPMERQKAQMELFRKYHYNPMSGCWVMLIQLPIFIALYRALLVDVELRHAPMFSEAIRFCSNLAAPDMMFYWGNWVWETIGSGYGFFGLGPYFNLLPILTIVLFIAQQKLFMPPAIDEQARIQQKMMTYMMIFFGFCFFKVPSGLCFYFIISSLWGLLERRFMPKAENLELTADGNIIDVKARVPQETFREKVLRLSGKQTTKETPQERNQRRKSR